MYTTTTDPSLLDTIGTETAKAFASGLGSVIERIDPGAAPGVRATVYGIDRGLDADLEARSTHTIAREVDDLVYDEPYYTYTSHGQSVYNNYDW